jgi:hypothetical protein
MNSHEDRMKNDTSEPNNIPDAVATIRARGYVVWADERLSPEFRSKFASDRIPVVSVRHVRLWGIQVDDEMEILGHERTAIPDEELWEVLLRATDGTVYEVNFELVVPAPV